MAIDNSITFGGVNSADYGIYIGGEGVFNAPERDVEMVSIPGRNGSFALDKGRFENIKVTYSAFNYEADLATFSANLDAFRNALCAQSGYQRLTDTFHPDEYRMAAFIGGLEIKPIEYNTASKFDIVFDCKPQRWLTSGEEPITIGEWGDTETVTGDIVEVENPDGQLGVKSLTVALEPIQDLNGYDKPWSGGNGKNKLNLSLSTIKALNSSAAGWTWNDNVVSKSGVSFTIQEDTQGNIIGVAVNGTNTTSTDLYLTLYEDLASSGALNDMILNGCPSGGGYNSFGLLLTNVTTRAIYDHGSGATIDNDDSGKVKVQIVVIQNYTANNLLFKPMIRLSSETDATYEPYSNICPISGRTEVKTIVSPTTSATDGRTYTTSLGRTVYGGTLDVVSGVLTVDRAMVDLGTLSWIYESAVPRFYSSGIASVAKRAPASNKKANIICSAYRLLALDGSDDSIYGSEGNGGIALSAAANISVKDTSYTNATAFKTAMNGVQLCYELATPQTYQLSPQEISLLQGTNNVWSDGSITLEYGQLPNVITNPTLFPASPLLECKGHGDIYIGGVPIVVSSVPIGDILLSNGAPFSKSNMTAAQTAEMAKITLDVSNLNTGDNIHVSESNITYSVSLTSGLTFSGVVVELESGESWSTKCAISTPTSAYFRTTVPAQNFKKGTAATKTYRYTQTWTAESGYVSSSRPIVIQLKYDGANTITFSATTVSNEATYTYAISGAIGQVNGYSTIIVNNTFYIDLEIGEAYFNSGSSYTSANYAVQIPPKLPTLRSGASTITYSNTITNFKITPRWWKI